VVMVYVDSGHFIGPTTPTTDSVDSGISWACWELAMKGAGTTSLTSYALVPVLVMRHVRESFSKL
jgi:hypothetical protein